MRKSIQIFSIFFYWQFHQNWHVPIKLFHFDKTTYFNEQNVNHLCIIAILDQEKIYKGLQSRDHIFIANFPTYWVFHWLKTLYGEFLTITDEKITHFLIPEDLYVVGKVPQRLRMGQTYSSGSIVWMQQMRKYYTGVLLDLSSPQKCVPPGIYRANNWPQSRVICKIWHLSLAYTDFPPLAMKIKVKSMKVTIACSSSYVLDCMPNPVGCQYYNNIRHYRRCKYP